MTFTPATKSKSKLRCAIFGPSGSGKTFTALRMATGIGGRIEGMINATREAETVLVLDGCQLECAKKTLEQAGIDNFRHVQITDLGLVKGQSPVNDENIRLVADKGKSVLIG